MINNLILNAYLILKYKENILKSILNLFHFYLLNHQYFNQIFIDDLNIFSEFFQFFRYYHHYVLIKLYHVFLILF
jgi:hypothetical protein